MWWSGRLWGWSCEPGHWGDGQSGRRSAQLAVHGAQAPSAIELLPRLVGPMRGSGPLGIVVSVLFPKVGLPLRLFLRLTLHLLLVPRHLGGRKPSLASTVSLCLALRGQLAAPLVQLGCVHVQSLVDHSGPRRGRQACGCMTVGSGSVGDGGSGDGGGCTRRPLKAQYELLPRALHDLGSGCKLEPARGMVIDRMYVVVGLQPGPIVVHIGSIHRSDKEPSLISFELEHETALRVAAQRDLKPRRPHPWVRPQLPQRADLRCLRCRSGGAGGGAIRRAGAAARAGCCKCKPFFDPTLPEPARQR